MKQSFSQLLLLQRDTVARAVNLQAEAKRQKEKESTAVNIKRKKCPCLYEPMTHIFHRWKTCQLTKKNFRKLSSAVNIKSFFRKIYYFFLGHELELLFPGKKHTY